jgi:Zn-dependent protease with chaperone function
VIYTNLLIFLSAIFLLSLGPEDAASAPSLSLSASLYGATAAGLWLLVKRWFKNPRTMYPSGYFRTERNLSIVALACFAVLILFGGLKANAAMLPLSAQVPVLIDIFGLFIFFTYLALVWIGGSRSYASAFGRPLKTRTLVVTNFKFNLPIILPWLGLSLMYNLLDLVDSDRVRRLLESFWGDLLFLGLFVLLVLFLFPPLVRRLWNCSPFPEGSIKDHLQAFCKRLDFKADLYVWPLFEGRVLTAGVMGLLPGLRYVMFTPALLQHLDRAELEAVMAHEIGHVKHRHLLLYVFLIGGFSIFAGLLAQPILYASLSMDWIYAVMARNLISAETLISLISGIPLLILLLVYFRYIFGYFIRNFERQADLYAFKVLGGSHGLVSAFKKIILVSGQNADKPNWHHFGIGERIACLESCERDPSLVRRQDGKLRRSLLAYLAVLAVCIAAVSRVPSDQLVQTYEGKYIESVVIPSIAGIETDSDRFRLLGDLLQNRGLGRRAIDAYDDALRHDPDNYQALNNLAWLLLTSGDQELRDPERALELADAAAVLAPLPHILDTLATAYWAQGDIDKAVATETKALRMDPEQEVFYRLQLERFRTSTYRSDTLFID